MGDPAGQIKVLNRWVARIVPVVLIGIVGYVTWVIVVLISIDYLIHPQANDGPDPRPGAAAAVLVIYFLFFLIVAVTYFRLLWTVLANPGYVERSAQYYAQKAEDKRLRAQGKEINEKDTRKPSAVAGPAYTNGSGSRTGSDQRPSVEEFIKREVFICQGDGRPIYCTTCHNYKPDRAHHCREVGRCVRKMDHFCPWVGGIVSETSFKFFVQFVGWTSLFCTFILILVAILADENRKWTGSINVHWIVTIGLAGLFGLFTMGMTGSSMQFVLLNTTTIENLSRKSVTYQLAIHVPHLPQEPPSFPTITYSTIQVPPGTQPPPHALKRFAILHSKPGDNPWDLGVYRNFKEVMGEYWYDWLVPVRHSPCTNHDRVESQFAVGPVVQRMKREAGIGQPVIEEKPHRRRRHRRRRSGRTGVHKESGPEHSNGVSS